MVSVGDIADRAPRAMDDGEDISLGRHRVRWFATPHLPHTWECGFLAEETTRTLLCGDLFTQGGAEHPITNMGIASALMAAGPGAYSLDALLGIRLPRWLLIPGFAGVAGTVAYALYTKQVPQLQQVQQQATQALQSAQRTMRQIVQRTQTTQTSQTASAGTTGTTGTTGATNRKATQPTGTR